MRYTILLLSLCPALTASVANIVTLAETTGTARAGVPFTISSVFKQGEITGCAQPVINGVALTEWQCNPLTRWRDGTRAGSITGVANSGSGNRIRITDAGHGYRTGERVLISNVGGVPGANGTWTIRTVDADHYDLWGTTYGGTYTGSGTSAGPAPGSLQHALISFRYSLAAGGSYALSYANSTNYCHLGSQTVCEAAGLSQQQMLDFDAGGGTGSWGAGMAVTQGNTVTPSARVMLAAGAWRYRTSGPVATTVIIEDRSTVLAYDFGWKDRKYTTIKPSCSASATSCSQSSSSTTLPVLYGGDIAALTLPVTIQVDSEQMIVTAVSDNNLTVTRGANGTTAATHSLGALVNSVDLPTTWEAAPAADYNSLHPIFVATFYPGWSGVKVEYILENTWTTKFQDQPYSYTLLGGAALDQVQKAASSITHYPFARWRWIYWNGSAPASHWNGMQPGSIRIDHNLAYLAESKVIPQFDPTISVTDLDIIEGYNGVFGTAINNLNATDRVLEFGDNGEYQQVFSTTGGRPEIGFIPQWHLRYLYNPTTNNELVSGRMGAVSGHVPIHIRESRSDATTYCAATCTGTSQSTTAFGRPLSLDARPSIWTTGGRHWGPNGYSTMSDTIFPVGNYTGRTNGTMGGWTVDCAHQGGYAFVPYLTTGDWYYEEELTFWAATDVSWTNPARYTPNGRGRQWGFLNPTDLQERGLGWAGRNLLHAVLMVPDGKPEKEYLQDKLMNQSEILEGIFNITTGYWPPADASCTGYANGFQASDAAVTDKWCFGRKAVEYGRTNPLYLPTMGQGAQPVTAASDICNTFAAGKTLFDCEKSSMFELVWTPYFVGYFVSSAVELGYVPFAKYQDLFVKSYIERALHPDGLPFMFLGGFYLPELTPGNADYLQTWADVKAVYRQKAMTLDSDISATADRFTVTDASGFDGWDGTPRTITAATNEANGVFTSSANNLCTAAQPTGLVYLTGLEGTSWAGAMGVHTLTCLDSDRFTINVNSTSFGAYPGGAIASAAVYGSTLNFPVQIDQEVLAVCARIGNLMIVGGNSGPCPSNSYRHYQNTTAGSHSHGAAVAASYSRWFYMYDNNVEGYPWMARSLLSFAPGKKTADLDGTDAWKWILTTGNLTPARAASVMNGDPRFALIPREVVNGRFSFSQQGRTLSRGKTRQ